MLFSFICYVDFLYNLRDRYISSFYTYESFDQLQQVSYGLRLVAFDLWNSVSNDPTRSLNVT